MLCHASLVSRFRDGAEKGSASHMFIEGDVIYSYGHHFPLAIRRDWGAGIAYLVNGDRYSVTTSQHQNLCIRALQPNVQIPFSALASANLMLFRSVPDIRIVAHRPDEYHNTCKHCSREITYGKDESGNQDYLAYCHLDDASPICVPGDGGVVCEHVLGAVVLASGDKCFLSSIDDQDGWRARAYFLCELPIAAATVGDAFASLVPNEVIRALTSGADVRRQGDIFAIETSLRTRELPGPTEHRAQLFGTSHVATDARRVNGTVYIRGTLRHEPQSRRAQHQMLRLGRSWWIAVKNLAVASWNAVGNVD